MQMAWTNPRGKSVFYSEESAIIFARLKERMKIIIYGP